MSKLITKNDLTNIFNEVLPTTSVNYVVETHIEPLTIAANGYVETTFTATKSGYFPLGIVGYRIGWVSGETGKCNIYSIEMTDKSKGSVTVAYAIYNTTSASVSMNLRVDILWAKVDGTSVSLQADCIVEQGTSGEWKYRKWDSGIAEAWTLASNGSTAMTTEEGYGYYAPAKTYTFPSIFTTIKSVVTLADLSGALGGFVSSNITATSLTGYFWATRSVTKNTFLNIEVKGTWK